MKLLLGWLLLAGICGVALADTTWPIVQQGDRGETVVTAQFLLQFRGHLASGSNNVDGVFGPMTRRAVISFQTANGLGQDGVVGTNTFLKLIHTLRKSDSGTAVKAVQSQLIGKGFSLEEDGYFGPITESKVKSFQTNRRLPSDGVVGRTTWAALVSSQEGGQTDVSLSDYVAIDRSQINDKGAITALKQSSILKYIGRPGAMTKSCSKVTNRKLKGLLLKLNVGPFTTTGMKPAVESLKRVFDKVKTEKPQLFNAVSTAGMLCCRAVRGSTKYYSNHAWGSAVDLKINGILDPRGDAKALRGLHQLAPYFEEEKWFWGAAWSGKWEDAMHFEVSEQLLQDWHNAGIF